MMLSPAERRAKINAVIRVSAGNFLEMYDFIIYGYYASYIAHTFFPAGNEFVSLMSALIAYGAGFLVRPIGAFAPIIIVIGRLVQGFSSGVEIGGCSVYLAEIATPGNRGFYCAWQSGSQQVAVMLSAALGVALTSVLLPEQ